MEKKIFKIEKNIPYKRKGRKGHAIFPFEKMEEGDSFFVSLDKGKNIASLRCQLHSNAKSYCLRNKLEWKFTTRIDIENNGVRIWRLK